ncbi:MAG: ADP-forming succinate--CoA ligase subunit beta, partial [Bacteroidia bacterium]|nr:ADP-forming succinate--CoA ligase subunit beta [Bacteroidia bacterium]
MKIHEYQGKEIFRKYGVPVPKGIVVKTPEEAKQAAIELGSSVIVVKSQIHAGGRGQGKVYDANDRSKMLSDRGVKVVKSPQEAEDFARLVLGNILVTKQTGEEGKIVKTMYIEEGCAIEKEYYLSITLDRSTAKNVIIASAEGGMDIEKVAEEHPEKIVKEWIDPLTGLRPYQITKIGYALGFTPDLVKQFIPFMNALYKCYMEGDCSLVEVNPMVVTKDGKILALDSKINFDDNALFRHPEYASLRDLNEEEPLEIEASQYNLNYIKLDGNVGCMVNGAGLAMATMDIIKLSGGEPANFLDVGGTANAKTVEAGFRIILKDPNVKAILIN